MLDRHEEYEFLRRFQSPGKKEVPVGYAMYCPYCKEGTAKTRRRVAYILTGNFAHDHNTFSCRRCGTNMSFMKFLQEQQPALYDEYEERDREVALQRLVEGRQKKREEIKRTYPDLEFIDLPESMIPAYQHAGAYKYCKRRLIPTSVIKNLKFAKKIIVESDGVDYEYDDMLVFPFLAGDDVYGFQARSITGKTFYTESIEGYKIYNFYNIDLDRDCFIFESIIDSFAVDNSISMLGSDLPAHFLQKIKKPVFVFDNDVTTATFKKMMKYSSMGHNVVIWPEFVKEKDCNEMICNDYSKSEIYDIIMDNIYTGVAAEVRLGIAMNRKKRR